MKTQRNASGMGYCLRDTLTLRDQPALYLALLFAVLGLGLLVLDAGIAGWVLMGTAMLVVLLFAGTAVGVCRRERRLGG
jgi:hypothetical protein